MRDNWRDRLPGWFDYGLFIISRLSFHPTLWLDAIFGYYGDKEYGGCKRGAFWGCDCDGIITNYLCWYHALKHKLEEGQLPYSHRSIYRTWKHKRCEYDRDLGRSG
jgi:hypothetical protein